MHPAVLDGATGGDQGLGGDLATEDALSLLVGLGAAEDVHLDLLEVEQADQLVEVVGHRTIISRSSRHCATPAPHVGAARRTHGHAGAANLAK